MNFISYDNHLIFNTYLPHFPKFSFGPQPAYRVMWIGEEKHTGIFGFFLKIIKVDEIFSILINQLIFKEFSFMIGNCTEKWKIHRWLHKNTITGFCIG